MASISLAVFVLVYFCISRHDVQECFKRIPRLLSTFTQSCRSSNSQHYNYAIQGNTGTKSNTEGINQMMNIATTANIKNDKKKQKLYNKK